MTRKRIVIAGMGDTGLLAAIGLSRHHDVVAISTKPGLVSGQELGTRITRPDDWARDYLVPFDRYRRLDDVRIVLGTLVGLDVESRRVRVRDAAGDEVSEAFDSLVIATGARNGFWRLPSLQTAAGVKADLRASHVQFAEADSVIVVGGGAAAVNSAFNLATTWPTKRIDLYFPGEHALAHHHPRVWRVIAARLETLGVGLHPRHRAVVPKGFDCDEITSGPVTWSTGQQDGRADAVLWTIGRARPNTGWLPSDFLDDSGFVRVDPDLTVSGQRSIFAIGDVAATDPLRSSARNRADRLLVRNVRADLAGRSLQAYRPPRRRWGSVLGTQNNGLEVFTGSGFSFRFPAWTIETLLQAWIVRRGIYRGVRRGPVGMTEALGDPEQTGSAKRL
jgi:NADH dehydrogenase FAD-containing subunit